MKLSICIPIYQFYVGNLVSALLLLIENSDETIEIILLDDGSDKKYRIENRKLKSDVVRYEELDYNIGRSKIRNLFLQKTKGDYLLFLDCDGLIWKSDFLENYIQSIQNTDVKVVYGGRRVSTILKNKNYYLRWNYAQKRETPNANSRQLKEYLCFQTNNFLVEKSVLSKNPFDESILQYGYEDLIFAMNLKEKKIAILHIENTILNDDIENNQLYLSKTEQALKMLHNLYHHKSKRLTEEIRLIQFYEKSRKFNSFIILSFYLFKKPIRYLLAKQKMPLNVFDWYKLAYFSQLN